MKQIFSCLLISFGIQVTGQPTTNATTPPSYEELLFCSTDNGSYVSGETIHVSLFCLNKEDLSQSKVSTVAYIALVDEERRVVHKRKVRLNNGYGATKIFAKSSYATGNYYLVVHTSLMLNQPTSDIFYQKVGIINPFVPYANPSDFSKPTKEPDPSNRLSEKVQIRNLPQVVTQKSKVSFEVVSQSTRRLSVMIHAIDSLGEGPLIAQNRVVSYLEKRRQVAQRTSNYTFLPDTKGELIIGSINGAETDTLSSPPVLFASFPGDKYDLFATLSADKGDQFFFVFPAKRLGQSFVIQSPNCPSCTFSTLNKFLPNYDFLEIEPLVLKEEQLQHLNKRSIASQIENAYFSPAPNAKTEAYLPFFGTAQRSYRLSDYTPFRKMEDVFKEVTTTISLRKSGEDYQLKVLGDGKVVDAPLVLVDGILSTANEVVTLPPTEVRKIDVVNKPFHLGPLRFEGIISIETTRSLLDILQRQPQKPIEYTSVAQTVPSGIQFNREQRIPTYNNVLYWDPYVEVPVDVTTGIQFYTGDRRGHFQVSIVGLDDNGNFVSTREVFTVE